MGNLDVGAFSIIGDGIKLILDEDVITSLVGVEHLNIKMSFFGTIDGIKDIEDWGNTRSTSNQANLSCTLITSAFVLKVSITLVLAHTNRSFTSHGIADVQCAEIVTHFATGWELLGDRVALDYKVDVTFGVDWRDRGVRAANYGFAFR